MTIVTLKMIEGSEGRCVLPVDETPIDTPADIALDGDSMITIFLDLDLAKFLALAPYGEGFSHFNSDYVPIGQFVQAVRENSDSTMHEEALLAFVAQAQANRNVTHVIFE